MDTSTLIFVGVLAAAFLVLRWIITPIPQSVPEEFNIPDPQAASASREQVSRRAPRRQVNDSMVEIVQAIGPQLTRAQIVYSLEKTGNVEETVNAYMETGSLPFPPGQRPARTQENGDGNSGSASATSGATSVQKHANLLEKYDITPELMARADENGLFDATDENADALQNRRVEMILRARKRLEKTLSEPPLQ